MSTLIQTVKHYIGTAAERGALDTTGLQAGSTHFDTDTPALYIWDGSAWVEHIATVQTGDTINIANIEGIDAEGDPLTANPLVIGIEDDSGNSQPVSSSNPVPTQLTGSYEQIVTIANAVNITDTSAYTYDLIGDGGLTAAQIRQYKEFKISIYDTHSNVGGDATATVDIRQAVAANSESVFLSGGEIYSGSDIADGTSRLVYASKAGGAGAASGFKTIAALEGVFSDLFVRVTFANAPDSGALTIKIEMRG